MMYILWVNIIVIHTCQQIVQKKKKKEMNSFCVCLSEALQSKFDIDANIFVLKKKENNSFAVAKAINSVSIL